MARNELGDDIVSRIGELVNRLGLETEQEFNMMPAGEFADWQRRRGLIRESYFKARPGSERVRNFIEAERQLFNEVEAYLMTWDLGTTLLLVDLLKKIPDLPTVKEFKKFGDQVLPLAAVHARAAKKIGVETPRLVLRWIRYDNGTEEGDWWLNMDIGDYSSFSSDVQADQYIMAVMRESGRGT